jgi:hypothetical protein
MCGRQCEHGDVGYLTVVPVPRNCPSMAEFPSQTCPRIFCKSGNLPVKVPFSNISKELPLFTVAGSQHRNPFRTFMTSLSTYRAQSEIYSTWVASVLSCAKDWKNLCLLSFDDFLDKIIFPRVLNLLSRSVARLYIPLPAQHTTGKIPSKILSSRFRRYLKKVRMCVRTYVFIYVCSSVYIYCIYVCMYVCVYAYIHVCVCVCVCVYNGVYLIFKATEW